MSLLERHLEQISLSSESIATLPYVSHFLPETLLTPPQVSPSQNLYKCAALDTRHNLANTRHRASRTSPLLCPSSPSACDIHNSIPRPQIQHAPADSLQCRAGRSNSWGCSRSTRTSTKYRRCSGARSRAPLRSQENGRERRG